MPYEINTMVGDYPVDNQPFYGKEFTTLEQAIDVARLQHDEIGCRPRHTIVMEVDKYEKVLWLKYDGQEYDETSSPTANEKANELENA
jgi:hypothetical protein